MATAACFIVALVFGVQWSGHRQVHHLSPLPQFPLQATYIFTSFLTETGDVHYYLIGKACHLEGIALMSGLSAGLFGRFFPQALCFAVFIFGRGNRTCIAVLGLLKHPDLLFEIDYFLPELLYEQPLFFDQLAELLYDKILWVHPALFDYKTSIGIK